jgi:hypothetical protein
VPNGVVIAGEAGGNESVGRVVDAGTTFHGELVDHADSVAMISDPSTVSED